MIKNFTHICKGTCSRSIEIIYDDETLILKDINVIGGCNGNLKGIKALVQDRPLEEVYSKLNGIRCGIRPTSCPDQLSIGIKSILESLNK